MLTPRPSHARGHADYGWLKTQHSFSFANYYDPRHMGVSVLRVINEDWIQAGKGFETHPHRDMEIISYIVRGSVAHRDTMGSNTRLMAGEVQVMTAGSGIFHSEFNPSDSEELHLLQIWITPAQKDLTPCYAQKNVGDSEGLTLIVSPDGREGSLKIHQDASLYQLKLHEQAITHTTMPGRQYYLQVIKGALIVNGIRMDAGDGAGLIDEDFINIETRDRVEALLFDLPAE